MPFENFSVKLEVAMIAAHFALVFARLKQLQNASRLPIQAHNCDWIEIRMKVALIPARGGSKRIPRKNIRLFGGKPIIAWPIEAAISSNLFDRVVVTTDDPEIRDVSIAAGAEVPFLRPDELSDDHATLRQVIRHAIEALEIGSNSVEALCCIYATAAFIQPSDLSIGYERLKQDGAQYAFAAVEYPHPIQRAFSVGENGEVLLANADAMATRTQDLTTHYYDAGMFFWGWRDAFFTDVRIYSSIGRIVPISPSRVHDIDTPDDWEKAELAFEVLRASV